MDSILSPSTKKARAIVLALLNIHKATATILLFTKRHIGLYTLSPYDPECIP